MAWSYLRSRSAVAAQNPIDTLVVPGGFLIEDANAIGLCWVGSQGLLPNADGYVPCAWGAFCWRRREYSMAVARPRTGGMRQRPRSFPTAAFGDASRWFTLQASIRPPSQNLNPNAIKPPYCGNGTFISLRPVRPPVDGGPLSLSNSWNPGRSGSRPPDCRAFLRMPCSGLDIGSALFRKKQGRPCREHRICSDYFQRGTVPRDSKGAKRDEIHSDDACHQGGL